MNALLQHSVKVLNKNEVLVCYLYNYILDIFSEKYSYKTKNQMYGPALIVTEIIYFMKSGVSYEDYRGPLSAKTLCDHIHFFEQNKIFQKVYQLMHKDYSVDNKNAFKYQSIDTSYIVNKNGKINLGRNKHNKNKNCYKLSFIVDSNRIPCSTICVSGNHNDAKIGNDNIDAILDHVKDINAICKPYMLGDKMYDTKEFRDKCSDNGYKPIIDYNRRNTRDNKLIKRLIKKEREIYVKRIKVENAFCIAKKNKRIQLIYDSSDKIFISFVYLAECRLIQKYLKPPIIKHNIEIPTNALELDIKLICQSNNI